MNYRLTETKCIRLSKEALYYETDTPITLSFDIPFCYRKLKLEVTAVVNKVSYELPIINNTVLLPNPTQAQRIELMVRGGGKIWLCDNIEIKSLTALKKEVDEVLPEYAALTAKYTELEARVKALEDTHKITL